MKTNHTHSGSNRLRNLVLAATLIGLGSAGSICKAASPVGTWDFVSSGSGQQGLAYITFADDFTFNGYVLVAGKRKSPSSDNGRGGTPSTGRNGPLSGANEGSSLPRAHDILFGFTPINGLWNMDHGKVIGFFTEPVNVQSVVTNFGSTNVLESIAAQSNGNPSTNVMVFFPAGAPTATVTVTWDSPVAESVPFTFDNPNFTVEVGSAEFTNRVSFRGTVNGTKSFNMVSSTDLGKVSYQGLPAKDLAPRAGQAWNAIKTSANGQMTVEFFTLGTPEDAGFPNIYPITGEGPGYTFDGHAIFSRHKLVGFSTFGLSTLRASVGSFHTPKNGLTDAKTIGVEDPGSSIKYNATVQPAPPVPAP